MIESGMLALLFLDFRPASLRSATSLEKSETSRRKSNLRDGKILSMHKQHSITG